MKLSTCAILLAVFAVSIAIPDGYGKQYQQGKKYQSKTTLPPADVPKVDFDCSGKDDGGYVIGCNQDYYLCWEGVATKASCPDGMMFSSAHGGCDFNENIFECTGEHPTQAPIIDDHKELKPVDFDCSGKEDGDYAFGNDCQVRYVSCFGGNAIERTCPDELQFDPENRMCDRLENIVACGGAPTTAAPEVEIDYTCPSPSGSFALTAQMCSAVYYICQDNVASIAMCDEPMIWDDSNKICALPKDVPDCSFDCTGKADNAYSVGCAQEYWWCWEEKATKSMCPDGMMFDASRQLCDVSENVFECSGVQPTTPAFNDDHKEPLPVDFDCSGLQDGDYAFKGGKCLNKYVSCVGGIAWERNCPAELVFDPDMLLCERMEYIVACGGSPTTTVAQDVPKDNYGSYATKSYGYQKKTTTLADMPTTKAYGYKKKTTTLADIPTTQTYGDYEETTTLADVPTTRSYGYQKKTTTLADIPTTPAYNEDGYGQQIELDETTTMESTTRRHHKRHRTTTEAPVSDDSYGSYETTTLADIPTTTRRSYGKRLTTTLADVPTTRSYGYQKKTTLADIPTTKSYGYQKKTTTLADLPTTRSYGYKKTTTLADIPTTKAYGYQKKTTTLADVPTKSYGYQKKTTTLADLPTTRSYGYLKKTTTLADIPTTRSYGYQKKTTTLADLPTTRSYGYQKKTTTMADIPTTRSYGYQKKTTTLADIPTTKAYGYQKKTTTLADIPTTTMRRRSSYSKFVKTEQNPPIKQGY